MCSPPRNDRSEYNTSGHRRCKRLPQRLACSIATRTRPHTLIADTSHFFATDALASGLPPHIVQVLLGHKSIATTQGYAAIWRSEWEAQTSTVRDERRLG
jgi:site-specific recombinase XerD